MQLASDKARFMDPYSPVSYFAMRSLEYLADARALPVMIDWLLWEAEIEEGDPFEYKDGFTKIGIPAIDALLARADERTEFYALEILLSTACEASIMQDDYRRDDILVRSRALIERERNHPDSGIELVFHNFLRLHAVEYIDYIRKLFGENRIDPTFLGDMEDVEIAFGLRKERSKPREYELVSDSFPLSFSSPEIFPYDNDPYDNFPPYRHQEISPRILPEKIGVNDSCPCGSGKKYKKCCLIKKDNPYAR